MTCYLLNLTRLVLNYKDSNMKPQNIISPTQSSKSHVHTTKQHSPHTGSSKYDACITEDPCPDWHHLKKV